MPIRVDCGNGRHDEALLSLHRSGLNGGVPLPELGDSEVDDAAHLEACQRAESAHMYSGPSWAIVDTDRALLVYWE